MDSTVSPTKTNFCMEYFEDMGLRTAPNLPRLWKRFIDDTFVIQYREHKETFLQHTNNIESAIKCTVEDTRTDDFYAILDTPVTPEHNGTLTTSVYRNSPIQTDMCIGSHHHKGAKYSVINALTHRAKTVSYTQDLLRTEKATHKGSSHQLQIPIMNQTGWNKGICNKINLTTLGTTTKTATKTTKHIQGIHSHTICTRPL